MDTRDGRIVMPDEEAQLIGPFRRNDVPVAHVDFVLKEMHVGASFGEHRAADVLVLIRLVFVGIAHPELVAARKIVKETRRAKEMVHWRGDVLMDWAARGDGVDDPLLIVEVFIKREQERILLAAAERAGE